MNLLVLDEEESHPCEWFPIRTLPNDGRYVTLLMMGETRYRNHSFYFTTANAKWFYNGPPHWEGWVQHYCHFSICDSFIITHWKPFDIKKAEAENKDESDE